MKPSFNQLDDLDLLNGSFVSIPYAWLARFSSLEMTHKEFIVLLQILGAIQVTGSEILSSHALGELCKLSERETGEILHNLVERGFLAIIESDLQGTRSLRFNLSPLWQQLSNVPEEKQSMAPSAGDKDLVTLFEQEFGRPLSGLECEQIRQWLVDECPNWMLVEALREAVLANKCSFRYMDRILYDWQRNRIRSRQELDAYRQSYRDRTQAREETAAGSSNRRPSNLPRGSSKKPALASTRPASRDERYSAFYELFPDT